MKTEVVLKSDKFVHEGSCILFNENRSCIEMLEEEREEDYYVCLMKTEVVLKSRTVITNTFCTTV